MPNQNTKKRIEMSEKQMLVMREALEFYSRFLSGELDAIPDELTFKCSREGRADELRDSLQNLKTILFPELRPNEAYGISAPKTGDYAAERRQISYEMYRQIYVYQTRARKLAGEDVSMNVYDSPTMKYSDEDLIQINL